MKSWRTRDGRQIPLVEMSDEHLRNAILFLRRAHARYVDAMTAFGPPNFNGEMAQYYAEQEWSAALESTPETLYSIFKFLCAEQNRRLKANKGAVHFWRDADDRYDPIYICGQQTVADSRGTMNASETTCQACRDILKVEAEGK